jgi:hypothetical protein
MPTSLPARLIAAVAFSIGLLQGCANVKIDNYESERPQFAFRDYFNGTVDGWGIVQGRSGKVNKRFTVTIEGKWSGESGTLDENFKFSDGTTQRRVWTVRQQGPGRFTGTAADVVGEANGEAAGNALRWRYVMALPVDGTVYNIDFDDWMFLIDERVMLNRSEMRKFGIRVGELTISFVKR